MIDQDASSYFSSSCPMRSYHHLIFPYSRDFAVDFVFNFVFVFVFVVIVVLFFVRVEGQE